MDTVVIIMYCVGMLSACIAFAVMAMCYRSDVRKLEKKIVELENNNGKKEKEN